MSLRGQSAGLLVATTACLLLFGCGLPDGHEVDRIDDSKVPYDLLGGRPLEAPASPAGSAHPSSTEPRLYWVKGGVLAASTANLRCSDRIDAVVGAMLASLASGPGDAERAAGLSSALTPRPRLDLLEIRGRTAVVDLNPSTPLAADALPLAVGQIVLTVTSAPEVDKVILMGAGHRLQVPVPGGALTSASVSAHDYAPLLGLRDRGLHHAGAAPAGCQSRAR